jgi:hypothetical protein
MSSHTVQNARIEMHADSNEEMGELAELRRAKASLGDDYGPLDAEHIADDPIREERMAISIRMQRHDVQEWQQKRSTKIDMCALICLHLLSRDDATPLI